MTEKSENAIGPKDVIILLKKAERLGLDQQRVSYVGYGLCLVLKDSLEKGRVDELRYSILQELVDQRIEVMGQHLLAFQVPKPEDIHSPGDISILRSVVTNDPAGFPPLLLRRGFIDFGDTGGGKSTVLRSLAREWIAGNRACIVFCQKLDQFYFKLAHMFPGRCLLIKCSVDSFYNAFSTISGNATDYLLTKMQYWQVCFSRFESAAIKARIIRNFENEKLATGLVAPTLDYLIHAVETIDLPRSLFNPSLKASLYEGLILMKEGALGRFVMNCQVGLSLRELWSNKLVLLIETGRMRDDECHYMLSCILSDLREIKDRNPRLGDILVLVDEAGTLVHQRWDSGNRASPLSSEVVLLRGSEISLAMGFHTCKGISPQVRSNSAICLCGPMGNGDDRHAAAQSAGMMPEQDEALTHLKPYTAILKVTGTNYTEAVPVTWDPPADYPIISEAERTKINKDVFSRYKLTPIVPANFRHVAILSSTPAVPSATSTAPVSSSAKAFTPAGDYLTILQDLMRRPFLNVSERAAELNLPSKKVLTTNQLKAELDNLAKQGFCEYLTIQIKSRSGRGGEFYYLAANGHAAMGSLYKPTRGSYGHDLAQRLIQHILADKGITATIEDVLPGTSKKVDLGLICPHSKLHMAIEVCLSTFDSEPRQAQANLHAGWQRTNVCCLNTTDLKRLTKEFQKAGVKDPRISACVVADIRNTAMLSDIYDDPNCFV